MSQELCLKELGFPKIKVLTSNFEVEHPDTKKYKQYPYNGIKSIRIKIIPFNELRFGYSFLYGFLRLLKADQDRYSLLIVSNSGTPYEYILESRPKKECYRFIKELDRKIQAEKYN